MTNQTELLAALDDAYEACRETYGDADEAGARLSILLSLREQIAKGPVKWMDTKTRMTAESSHVGFVPLYTLTEADR